MNNEDTVFVLYSVNLYDSLTNKFDAPIDSLDYAGYFTFSSIHNDEVNLSLKDYSYKNSEEDLKLIFHKNTKTIGWRINEKFFEYAKLEEGVLTPCSSEKSSLPFYYEEQKKAVDKKYDELENMDPKILQSGNGEGILEYAKQGDYYHLGIKITNFSAPNQNIFGEEESDET